MMQRLQQARKRDVSAAQCAVALLDAVPGVVQFIRTEMRSHRGADLSVPQFRALALLSRADGASVSDVAEFLGLSLPATSRLVDGLVTGGLVSRQTATRDRRQAALSLTQRGHATWDAAREATLERLAAVVAPLSASERATIQTAMRLLHESFARTSSPSEP